MFYHLSQRAINFPNAFNYIIGRGYLSVDVFFILSGFVMALSYRKLFDGAALRRAYPVFLLRRLARTYPLYAAVILVVSSQDVRHAIQHHVLAPDQVAQKVAANLLFLQGVGYPARVVGPSWSVAVEFVAYLLFPLLLAATARRPRALLSATVAYMCLLLAAYLPNGVLLQGFSGPLDLTVSDQGPFIVRCLPVVRCLTEFTIGLCLFSFVGSKEFSFASPAKSFAVFAAILATLALPYSDFAFVPAAALLIAVLLHDNPVTKAFASRPVFFLGEISYAIYLWHFQLFQVQTSLFAKLSRHMGVSSAEACAMVCYWIVLIAISYASFRMIEVPGRRYVRKLEQRFFPAEDAALLAQERAASAAIDHTDQP